MYVTYTYITKYIEIFIPIIYKEILQISKKKLVNPMEKLTRPGICTSQRKYKNGQQTLIKVLNFTVTREIQIKATIYYH